MFDAGLDIAQNAAAVTPNDSADLANPGVIFVGTGGNVKVTTYGGHVVTVTRLSDLLIHGRLSVYNGVA